MNKDTDKIIENVVMKCIESGKIQIEQPKNSMFSDIVAKPKISIMYDILTCIMFYCKLAGISDISWFIVFIPYFVPRVLLLLGMLLEYFLKKLNKENKND